MAYLKKFKKINKCILLLFMLISMYALPVNAANEVDISNLGYREWKDTLSPFDVASYSSLVSIFPSSGVYTISCIFFSGVNMESQFSGMQIDNTKGDIRYVSSSSSGSGATSVLVFTEGVWADASYSRIIFFPKIASGQSIHQLAYNWLIECTKPFSSTSLVGHWFANDYIRPLTYDSNIDYEWLGSFTIDNVEYYKIKFFGNYTNFVVYAYTDTSDTFGIKLYSSNNYWISYDYRYLIVNSVTNTPNGFVDFFLLNYSTFTDDSLLFEVKGYYVFLRELTLPIDTIVINVPFSSCGNVFNRMIFSSSNIKYEFYNTATNVLIYSDVVYAAFYSELPDNIYFINDDYRYVYFSPAKVNSSTRSLLLANGTFNYQPPQSSSIRDLIFSFIDIPIHTISSLLSFEVFGTAAFSIFCSLILVALAIFILKKVL